MYHKFHLALVLFFITGIYQQVKAQNPVYVQEEVIKVANITSSTQVFGLNVTQKQTTRTYIDGLNRPIQTVAVQASPSQKDIVQPIAYDALGRQTTGYLPYATTNTDGSYHSAAITEQASYYNNGLSDKVMDDSAPWSQKVFENSPLQRLLQSGMVGDGFQPGQHYKSVSYRSNTAADNVVLWGTDGSYQNTYPANTLSVTDATDEDGAETLSFTDVNGRTVLKRQLANATVHGVSETYFDTYYIYNTAGLLSYIVQPKAVAKMTQAATWNLSQSNISTLIFKFVYDDMGRLVEKTVPGAGVVYIVYDPLNRPVLAQDANLRASNSWNYIKYDAKGRPISQGLYTDNTNTSRSGMQGFVNGLNYSNYNESRSNSPSTGYYTNSCFPTSGIQDLAYSYFDDYDLDQNGSADYTYSTQSLTGEATPTTLTRGLVTVIRKRSIGDGLNNVWMTNVMFYDSKNRLIQTQANNHLGTTLSDVSTTVADFTGTPTITKVTKVVNSVSTTVQTTFTYDHMYRLTAVDQSYNGAAAIRIGAYTYNEIGQLVNKKLGVQSTTNTPANLTLNSTYSGTNSFTATQSIVLDSGFNAPSGSTFSASIVQGCLQSVDFRYNIRGQLLSINNSTLTNDGVKNNDSNDLFGMEIMYDQVDNSLSNTRYFSGRVSAVRWMSRDGNGNLTNERSYKYSYDILNRFTSATYADRPSGGSWGNTGGFDESGITYDENGNLLTLQRNSSTVGGSSPVQIDNLTYTYDETNNPNRLLTVTDGTGSNYTGAGFRNYTGSSNQYSYDGNGNLNQDNYKGITLDYNLLNKINKVTITTATGRYIKYTYDASGKILRKDQYDNNAIIKTTDYIDGFEYENGSLTFFPTPEGRVRNVSGTLKNEYIIADQQGNARISFEDNGSGTAVIRQENSYYAFGLVMPNSVVNTPTQPNRQLYNGGSEWQNDYGNLPDYYQTFYRNYDAALGRFVAVDPMAESAESLTTYNYSGNNPIMFNDPLGDIFHSVAEVQQAINDLMNSEYGGYSDGGPDGPELYADGDAALQAGAAYNDANNSWGMFADAAPDYRTAAINYDQSILANGGQGKVADPDNQEHFAQVVSYFHDADGKGTTDENGNSGIASVVQLSSVGNITAAANQGGPGDPPGSKSKTDQAVDYARLISGGISIGNVLINKSALSSLPKWFVGSYGRSIVTPGAQDFTSVLSIQFRRLGWQYGGRVVGTAANGIFIGTTIYENVSYEKDIIQGKQNFDQVQSHYDNVTVSPMFWLYKRIEPWLISLGK